MNMTSEERAAYWKKYARQNTRYERSGVISFRKVIQNIIEPVIQHAATLGAQSALNSIDSLIKRSDIEQAYKEFYLYVGTAHKTWTDKDIKARINKKKDRGMPSVLIGVDPADAGFSVGFFNPKWLRKLRRLVQGVEAGKRITGVTDIIKKKLRNVLELIIKEEVRPSVIAARIRADMGQFSEARAKLIARTESTYISNMAARESALEAGLKLVKIWISTLDARVRDSHWKIPDPIKFEDKFKVGDAFMDKPGDPEGGAAECCNCRCTVAYLPDDDHEDIFPEIIQLPQYKPE